MKKKQDILSVLDLGTFKTCVLTANIEHGDAFNVVGVGYCATKGIKNGVISDILYAEQSIINALNLAESKSGVPIKEIYVNVSGRNLKSNTLKSLVMVYNRVITNSDICDVLSNYDLFFEKSELSENDFEIIHVIPVGYVIDDFVVENPVGMMANVLTVHVHVIFAHKIQLNNLRECLLRCGVNVIGFIANVYAVGFACDMHLNKINKLCIDFGAGNTNVCIFNDGCCVDIKNVSMGSASITNDIAYGLGTSVSNAERIKVLHGCANVNVGDDREMIMVPMLEDDRVVTLQQITKNNLNVIIEPRVDEVLAMLKKSIQESKFYNSISSEIVITGGGSSLVALKDVISLKFNKKVRIKKIENLGLSEFEYGGEYACAIGMIKYLIHYNNCEYFHEKDSGSVLECLFLKVINYFSSLRKK